LDPDIRNARRRLHLTVIIEVYTPLIFTCVNEKTDIKLLKLGLQLRIQDISNLGTNSCRLSLPP